MVPAKPSEGERVPAGLLAKVQPSLHLPRRQQSRQGTESRSGGQDTDGTAGRATCHQEMSSHSSRPECALGKRRLTLYFPFLLLNDGTAAQRQEKRSQEAEAAPLAHTATQGKLSAVTLPHDWQAVQIPAIGQLHSVIKKRGSEWDRWGL